MLAFLLVCACTTLHAELPDPTRFSVRLELGDLAQASAWLDEGLDPNFEGHLIGTGLMIGAWEGNIPLMTLFLERGADLDRTNRFGETAVMLAAWKNQPAALQWLIDHGAKINRPDRQWTALHYAAFAGHAGVADTLIGLGADVNARSTNGSTIVMMAAREGHVALAKRLLDAGANPALKNDFEDDAVAWAMKQGHYEIAKTLTSSAHFAALSRQMAEAPPPPRPQRSIPAPDAVEDYLRMARLAESQGKRTEALTAYRKALAELKTRESKTTSKTKPAGTAKNPQALVIRAKRDKPSEQAMALTYRDDPAGNVEELFVAARKAEAAGQRAEALRLYREAAARLKAAH